MKIKKYLKHHFQLLEVMIAAFILIVCVAPTMEIFTNLFREQQRIVQQNQRDHLAKKLYAQIVEQLYKRTLPLDFLFDRKTNQIDQGDLKAELDQIGYEGFYSFTDLRKKKSKGKEETNCYLATLTVVMKEKNPPKKGYSGQNPTGETRYTYKIFIDSGACLNPNSSRIEDGMTMIRKGDTEEYNAENQLIKNEDAIEE